MNDRDDETGTDRDDGRRAGATAMGSRDLAVDLDGTLLLTDALVEGALMALFTRPIALLAALFRLRQGRAAFKAALAAFSAQRIEKAPLRTDLVAWLEQERASGRRLHLVTAADRRVADAAARRAGLFDDVIASDGIVNLKGEAKRGALDLRFPGGWSYAGDGGADARVFSSARSVVLAGRAARTSDRHRAEDTSVEALFPGPRLSIGGSLSLMRAHQWAKNLLLFVPALLAGVLFDPAALLPCLAGFALLSVCASGTYILNDIADIDADRRHPSKCRRPLASGEIDLMPAFLAAVAMIAASLTGSLFFDPWFALLLAGYLATTFAYSWWAKRAPMLDVSILAGLYTLRLEIGAVLAGVSLSSWLVGFSLMFFLSLSLAKRHTEIVAGKARGLVAIPGRGYRAGDAPVTLTFGVASGMIALLQMVLFLFFVADSAPNYQNPGVLRAAPVLCFLWLSRLWLLASRGELHDDPLVFALRDRVSIGIGLVTMLIVLLAVGVWP